MFRQIESSKITKTISNTIIMIVHPRCDQTYRKETVLHLSTQVFFFFVLLIIFVTSTSEIPQYAVNQFLCRVEALRHFNSVRVQRSHRLPISWYRVQEIFSLYNHSKFNQIYFRLSVTI